MSRLLLALGSALVVLLLVVLVTPFLINWNGYRPLVAAQLESALGQPVTIAGDLDIGLLPRLRLEARDVVLGDPDAPLATLASLTVTSAIISPLTPDPVLNSLVLTGLDARLAFDGEGRLRLAGAPEDAATAFDVDTRSLGIERFVLDGARLTLATAPGAEPVLFDDVDAVGRAGRLTGPWTLEGVLAFEGARYGWDVGTGEAGDGTLRAKGRVSPLRPPTQRSLDVAFDATLGWRNASATRAPIAVSGQTVIVSSPPRVANADADDRFALPWRVEANAVLDPARAVLSDIEARIGPEEIAATLVGQASYEFDDDAVDVALSARQIDLDRLLGDGVGEASVPVEVAEAVRALLLPADEGDDDDALPRLAMTFDSEGVVLGGDIVRRVRLDAVRTSRGTLNVAALEATPPGMSAATLSGRLSRDGTRFRGPFAARNVDVGKLLEWATGVPTASPPWAGRPFQLDGALIVNPTTAVFDDVAVDLGAAGRLRGTVGLGRGEDGRWAIKLAGNGVDVNRLAGLDLEAVVEAVERPFELDLDLEAVSLGGDAPVDVERLRVVASGDARKLVIERLDAALDGTRVTASGEIARDGTDGTIELTVEATRLDGMLAAAGAVEVPDAIVEAVRDRAPELLPLRLTGAVVGARDEAGQRTSLRLEGDLRGTRTVARLQRFVADEESEPVFAGFVDASGPDSATLFRQLGFSVSEAASGADPLDLAAFELSYEGDRSAGAFELALEGFGGRLDMTGRAAERDNAPSLAATVELDISNLARARALVPARWSVPVPEGEELPSLVIRTELDASPSRLALDDLGVGFGEERVSGRLELVPGDGMPRLSGRLDTTTLSAPWFLGALTGAAGDAPLDAPFGTPLLSAWQAIPLTPSTASRRRLDVERRLTGGVEIEAEAVDLGPFGQSGRGRLSVSWPSGSPSINNLNLRALGGRLTGRIDLDEREIGRGADATLALAGARLGPRAGGAPLQGDVDMTLALSGAGRSPATLIRSLEGSGVTTLSDLRLRDLDAQAFARTVAAVGERENLIEEEIAEAFRDALLGGTIEVGDLTVPILVENGRVSAENIQAEGDGLAVSARASIDLADLTPSFALTLAPTEDTPDLDEELAGSVLASRPRVRFSQPRGADDVFIDARSLLRAIETARIEREIERLREVEQDVLERDRLSRQLRELDRARGPSDRPAATDAAAAADAPADAEPTRAPADDQLEPTPEPEPAPATEPIAEPEPEPAPTPAAPAASTFGRALRDALAP